MMSQSIQAAELEDLSVLVVEDNPVLREIIHDVLKAMGIWKVDYTRTADRALRLNARQRHDLVIAEFGEGPAHGLDVLKALKAEPETAKTPFVALAPFPTKELVLDLRDAGVHALVPEPISPKSLERHIRGELGLGPAAPKFRQAG